MEETFVNLPFGKIEKKELRPWLIWLSKRDFGEFASFPEIVLLFKEILGSDNPKSTTLISYIDGALGDPDDFIKNELLFHVNFHLFKASDCYAKLFVKFFLVGTVSVDAVYFEKSLETKMIRKNLDKIDRVFEVKEADPNLRWEKFIKLYEAIESGTYNEEIIIPKFPWLCGSVV